MKPTYTLKDSDGYHTPNMISVPAAAMDISAAASHLPLPASGGARFGAVQLAPTDSNSYAVAQIIQPLGWSKSRVKARLFASSNGSPIAFEFTVALSITPPLGSTTEPLDNYLTINKTVAADHIQYFDFEWTGVDIPDFSIISLCIRCSSTYNQLPAYVAGVVFLG